MSERLAKYNTWQRIVPNMLFLAPKRFCLRISVVVSTTLKYTLKTL